MDQLRDDDDLLEITVRVCVRKQDATAVVSLAERQDEDETEEDKVLAAVLDFVDGGLLEHDRLLHYAGATAWRVPTVKYFEDFRTLGKRSHRTRLHKKQATETESPLTKKRNKGSKISLDTADRSFAWLQERRDRLPDHEEFGVAVHLILLFGSYLRREPEVGDIDLAS